MLEQEHAEEHLNAVNGLVSFADARLADMQALYVVVEERLQGMAASQECAPPLHAGARHRRFHVPNAAAVTRSPQGALFCADVVSMS